MTFPPVLIGGLGAVGGVASAFVGNTITGLFANRRQRQTDTLNRDTQRANAQQQAEAQQQAAQQQAEAALRSQFLTVTAQSYGELVDKVNTLALGNVALSGEVGRLSSREAVLTEQLGGIKAENNELRRAAQIATELGAQVANMQRLLAAGQDENRELRQELETMKSENQVLRAELATLQLALVTLKQTQEGGS